MAEEESCKITVSMIAFIKEGVAHYQRILGNSKGYSGALPKGLAEKVKHFFGGCGDYRVIARV
jgi:hypothetical protein